MSTLTDAAPAGAAEAVTELTYREAINAALDDAMAADEAVLLMGEDVSADGGVFKTNIGLAEKYGLARVRNTPICENGFLGVALGMSLVGMRPIVEIMFADFLPTAGDAIVNQLPKYRYMSGGQTAVPVTVRVHRRRDRPVRDAAQRDRRELVHAPAGAARRDRAARRAPPTACCAPRSTTRTRRSSTSTRACTAARGRWTAARSPRSARPPSCAQGSDVTIVATLLMVERALAAAEQLAADGIDAEVIDLRWLRPLDLPTVRASVEKTGRLVVAEEQVHAAGWGATIVSELTIGGVRLGQHPAAGQPARRPADPVHPAARGRGPAVGRGHRRRPPGRASGVDRARLRRRPRRGSSTAARWSSIGSRRSRCARRSGGGSPAVPTAWTTAARS